MSESSGGPGGRVVSEPVIELRGATRVYGGHRGLLSRIRQREGKSPAVRAVPAVADVNLAIAPAEVLGLAGESGSGKTTLGRLVSGALALSGGVRLWKGRLVSALSLPERHTARLSVQMIFQDAHASLNPRMRVGRIIGEAPAVHALAEPRDIRNHVSSLLERVGLGADFASRYPHQLSGGERSRVNIARALAVRPELVVADEPVAALDVSVQAGILDLFMALRREESLAMLFISHDLGVVRHLSDRTAIMYLGRIVETAATAELFGHPHHPYTQALIADMPRLDVRHKRYSPIKGDPPSPDRPPGGCPFHPRCPQAFARCRAERPRLRELAPGHYSACHLGE